MFTSGNSFSGFAAAMALTALVAGCGGVDLGLDNGAGSGVKQALLGKPAPEPNLPERPPLLLPPQNAALPVPGQPPQAALNNPQWPAGSDEAKKQAAAKPEDDCKTNPAAAQEERCRPGWFSRVFN
jgi:hypothetical protein